jgi:hypothetical protein
MLPTNTDAVGLAVRGPRPGYWSQRGHQRTEAVLRICQLVPRLLRSVPELQWPRLLEQRRRILVQYEDLI